MDKNVDLASIIIPTYNRISYLIEAVESCIAQTYANIEVLIIDDGSTDATEETILQLFQSDWKPYNIRFFKQINSGACAARNYGLSLANGHYIQFLDSDDILFAHKLEHQINFIKAHSLEGCSCFGYMGENYTDKNNSEIIGESFDSITDLIENLCNGVHVMQTSAPLWKKELLLKSDGWDEQLGFGDDLEYHIRVLQSVKSFEFLDEFLFFLRVHEQERLSDASKDIRAILSGIETQQKIVKGLKSSNNLSFNIRQGVIKNCRTLYVNLLKYRDNKLTSRFETWLQSEFDLKNEAKVFQILIMTRKIFGGRITDFLIRKMLILKSK